MSRRALLILGFVGLLPLLACQRAASQIVPSGAACTEGSTTPAAATIAAPSPDAGTPATAADGRAPVDDPYAELPEIDGDADVPGYVAERLVGFSDDDRSLVYEVSRCDPCPPEWTVVTPGAPDERFAHFYDPALDSDVAERRREKHDAEVDRKLRQLGVEKAKAKGRHLRGPFPYASRGLRFVTKTTRNEATGQVTLQFGGHVGEGPPVDPLKVTLGPHPQFAVGRRRGDEVTMYDPILAYANVTKSGKEIGIVVIAGGNYWYEAGGVARMPTDAFVAKITARASPPPPPAPR